VHQAVAGASEFLEGLFGIGSGGVNVIVYVKDGAEGVEVGGSVGSVRRTLKVRLCVCIPSEIDWNDGMMNDDDRHACRRYQITNLLQFFYNAHNESCYQIHVQ
jgi:hypothetical protein